MKFPYFIFVLLCACAVSYATVRLATVPATPAQAVDVRKQDAFDRVMNAGKIRCGYVINHPFLFKDANTGALSGISHDVIEKMAENLGLKMEWTEEVGWSSMLEGLSTGRYDVLCSAVWSTSNRGLKADFLDPLSYAGVHAWVRPDDHRFDKGLSDVDWREIKVATIDGHISDVMTRAKFSQAQRVSLPDLSAISDAFLAVSSGKADITFEENYVALEFLSSNPGTVKSVTKAQPLKVFPTTFLIPQGETKLKFMLNTAQAELSNSGYIGELVKRYETYPGSFYLPARPYDLNE